LPESERTLAPEWTEVHAEIERKEYRQQLRARGPQNVVAQELFKGSDFEEKAPIQESVDAGVETSFDTDAKHSSDSKERPMSGNTAQTGMKSMVSQFSQKADSAFEESDLSDHVSSVHSLVLQH